jgi:protein-S-isoprenylcysteine O-methyltransferase Ste14
VKIKAEKIEFQSKAANRSASKEPKTAPTTRPAKGAALVALPFALIFTVLIFLSFDISLFWALPIYAGIGSMLILFLILGCLWANRK